MIRRYPVAFYCVHAEFYDSGNVKTCMTSRETNRLSNNQYRQVPGMAAFKLRFVSESKAIEMLDLIRKSECGFTKVLQFYSDKLKGGSYVQKTERTE